MQLGKVARETQSFKATCSESPRSESVDRSFRQLWSGAEEAKLVTTSGQHFRSSRFADNTFSQSKVTRADLTPVCYLHGDTQVARVPQRQPKKHSNRDNVPVANLLAHCISVVGLFFSPKTNLESRLTARCCHHGVSHPFQADARDFPSGRG